MLRPRLRAIAYEVPKGAKVADIGTDHGLVPVYLIKEGIAKEVIAADISPGSLEKAIELIKREGFEGRIVTRLGPGLKVIEAGEVDTIIIAGMGGNLISKIIGDNPRVADNAERLILQPMSGQKELRKWLVREGYRIIDEALVKDEGYIYEIIVASPGRQELRHPIQYDIGFRLIEKNDPLFEEFMGRKIEKTRIIVEKLEQKNTSNSRRALKSFKEKLLDYEEAYRCFVQLNRLKR